MHLPSARSRQISRILYANSPHNSDNLSASAQTKRRWLGSGFCEKLMLGRMTSDSLVAFSVSAG